MMRQLRPALPRRLLRERLALIPEIRPPMTICIAALYRHMYGPRIPEDVGMGILTASDRMQTNEELGIEYEPTQGKWTDVTSKIALLVADNISVHSELIRKLKRFISDSGKTGLWCVDEVAAKYGELLQQLRAGRAAQFALSRYGLTIDKFIEKQELMDRNVLSNFDQEMASYEATIKVHTLVIKVQTLVIGFDPDDTAHIYYVDNHGITHCFDDIGFACIGIGHSHAVSLFASRSYANNWPYYPALLMTFAAKKSAEVAPGVGIQTDMLQIIKNGMFRVADETRASLDEVYTAYVRERQTLEENGLAELMNLDAINIEKAIAAGVASEVFLPSAPAAQLPSGEPRAETSAQTRPRKPPRRSRRRSE